MERPQTASLPRPGPQGSHSLALLDLIRCGQVIRVLKVMLVAIHNPFLCRRYGRILLSAESAVSDVSPGFLGSSDQRPHLSNRPSGATKERP